MTVTTKNKLPTKKEYYGKNENKEENNATTKKFTSPSEHLILNCAPKASKKLTVETVVHLLKTSSLRDVIVKPFVIVSRYFTTWSQVVLFLHVWFGFLECYAKAIRNTWIHICLVSFFFTNIYPRAINVEGFSMQGILFKVMDVLIHHLPCGLYLHYYYNELTNYEVDAERAARIESTSEWHNLWFYIAYRCYLAVAVGLIDVKPLYGIGNELLYVLYFLVMFGMPFMDS